MAGTSTHVRVERGLASGTFSLDGQTFEVENNIWVVGDDCECVVIDAPHSVDEIVKIIGDRQVKAIICTHAHDDHIRVAPHLRSVVNGGAGAPIMLHPDDRPLWSLTHHGPEGIDGWDIDLCDGDEIVVAGVRMNVLHTPGHAPGAVCLYVEDLGCVFTGDTLFHGGPGATGRSYSDRHTLENSIHERLFSLPGSTEVHTGHGDSTTIGAEKARMDVGV